MTILTRLLAATVAVGSWIVAVLVLMLIAFTMGAVWGACRAGVGVAERWLSR